MQGVYIRKISNQEYRIHEAPSIYSQIGSADGVIFIGYTVIQLVQYIFPIGVKSSNQYYRRRRTSRAELHCPRYGPKISTLAKIIDTEAHYNNVIRLTNQGKVIIKVFKDEGFMFILLNTSIHIMDLEYCNAASTNFQK